MVLEKQFKFFFHFGNKRGKKGLVELVELGSINLLYTKKKKTRTSAFICRYIHTHTCVVNELRIYQKKNDDKCKW